MRSSNLLAVASLLAAILAQASCWTDRPVKPPEIVTLEERVPSLMESAGIPGMAIGVLRGGKLSWSGYYGVKSRDTGEPVGSDTIFEAASLTKPVFAAMVMQLVADGEVRLDEPLWETLPYDRLSQDARAKKITGRMVLTHTPGLPNWGGDPLLLEYDPGQGWGYSGEGYVYFSKAVEKKMGQPVEVLVKELVLDPIGMKSSGFVWSPDFDQRVAVGHSELGRTRPIRHSSEANAAASLLTTLEDYAAFVGALIQDRPLAAGTLARMRIPERQASAWGPEETYPHVWWSRGWGVQKGEREALWHWGDNGSFRCFVLFYPDDGDGLIYFTNSENGLSITADLLNIVFPDDVHWSARWLTYDAWDDPSRMLRIRLRKRFLEDESGAMAELAEIRKDNPETVNERFLNRLGSFLLDEEKVATAVEVFRMNTTADPEVASAWVSLAEAQMQAEDFVGAVSSLRKATELDPSEAGLKDKLEWVSTLEQGLSQPIRLNAEQKQQLVGSYGPRQIRLENDRLIYQREGNAKSYPLCALSPQNFVLDGLSTFRIQFEFDQEGRPIAILGHYFDGNTDRTAR